MRLPLRALAATALSFGFFACAPAPSASLGAAAPLASGDPRPVSSGQDRPLASTVEPEEAAPSKSPLSLVLSTVDTAGGNSYEAYPFDGGAVLVLRSLIAVVLGAELRQEPRWLVGLPEFINWDADTILWPAPMQQGSLELPRGTVLGIHSGNLRGVSSVSQWDGRRWVPATEPRDRRLVALGEDAETSDGTRWAVTETTDTHQRALRRYSPSGNWETVTMPSGALPQKVWAGGTRLWVSAERTEELPHGETGSCFELYSTEPVREPLDVGALQIPLSDTGGALPGLSVDAVDVPSVSAAPAGPGTPACTSLVVYLGKTASPELRAVLAQTKAPWALTLVHVLGAGPGKVEGSRVVPSRRTAPAVATIPPDFAEGLRITQAVASALPASSAKLLCAVPRVTNIEHITPTPEGG